VQAAIPAVEYTLEQAAANITKRSKELIETVIQDLNATTLAFMEDYNPPRYTGNLTSVGPTNSISSQVSLLKSANLHLH
jgi:hypothetical protein